MCMIAVNRARTLKMWYVAFVCLAVLAPSSAQTIKLYRSPDRVLKAAVRTSSAGESRVEIYAIPERILLVRDETSLEGSSGYRVMHAAWTPDSQFFVAGTEAAGGHQPWARPIWIYSRAKNQVFELSKMGATATADFTLRSNDVMQTRVLNCENGKGDLRARRLIVRLHDLATRERLPDPPCVAW
jgi:hypothetical protein